MKRERPMAWVWWCGWRKKEEGETVRAKESKRKRRK
jgi:hypothetical protein